jgi:nitrile hydratase accessory protein
MNRIANRIAADINSPTTIPRRNGEPVFREPWESRVFGMAIALCERELYDWDEFRERLISEISSADARGDTSTYYERFLAALEHLIQDKGICPRDEIDRYATAQLRDEDQEY